MPAFVPNSAHEIAGHPIGHPSEWLLTGQEVALNILGTGLVHVLVTATSMLETACEFTAHGLLIETDQAVLCTFYHPQQEGLRQTLRVK